MSPHRIMAELTMSPVSKSAITSQAFAAGKTDLKAAIVVIAEKTKNVLAGDLTEVESTLIAQAVSLDTIFIKLAGSAAVNMNEHLDAADHFMRMALQAQAQCRATLETIAAIKNPATVAFVRQANIANGPQQINNGGSPRPVEIEKT